MIARLPIEKVYKAIYSVIQALTKRAILYKQLESLAGLLSFATKVIPLGRPYIRSIYTTLTKRSIFYRVHGALKADFL